MGIVLFTMTRHFDIYIFLAVYVWINYFRLIISNINFIIAIRLIFTVLVCFTSVFGFIGGGFVGKKYLKSPAYHTVSVWIWGISESFSRDVAAKRAKMLP